MDPKLCQHLQDLLLVLLFRDTVHIYVFLRRIVITLLPLFIVLECQFVIIVKSVQNK